jgi:hypothetical protein
MMPRMKRFAALVCPALPEPVRGAPGNGAIDPARCRDRGDARRHDPAAHSGGRALAQQCPRGADQRSSINAFVAGGQIVYVHSGLIDAADNANEVQGVIAHEIGHIVGGHAVFQNDGGYTKISILSLLLGAAAMAAGAGEAGTGILMAGQRAAIGQISRLQPHPGILGRRRRRALPQHRRRHRQGHAQLLQQADRADASLWLLCTQSNPEVDPFAQTHPMSADRVENLRARSAIVASVLEQVDRSEAGSALQAGAGQVARLCQRARGDAAHLSRPISRRLRIMPAPMPIINRAIPSRRRPRPRRW